MRPIQLKVEKLSIHSANKLNILINSALLKIKFYFGHEIFPARVFRIRWSISFQHRFQHNTGHLVVAS